MLRAERKVRKSERPPWSPALKQASLTVKYYKLLRQQHLSKTVLSTAIQHTLKQMDISPEQPNSPQDYQRLLRKAQKHLQKTRREAQMHRMQYLETLLQRYKLLEDNNMQHILRQIIRAIDLHSKRLSKESGLTGPQLILMRSIRELGEVTIRELSNHTNMSQATATTILDRLERNERELYACLVHYERV